MTGHDLAVWLLPGDSGPLVLASVEIVTGRTKRPTVTEQELYDAIPRRHTNRWPYDDRHPVPTPILVAMQHAADREGGRLRVLGRRQVRTWLRAAHGADREQRDGEGCSRISPSGRTAATAGCQPLPSARPARSAKIIIYGGTSAGGGALRRSGTSGPALNLARRQLMRPRVLAGKTTALRLRPRAWNAGQLMVLSTGGDRPLDWLRAAGPSSTPC